MIQALCPVISVQPVRPNIYLARIEVPEALRKSLPGQFINIRVSETSVPLLRRPFSVYRVDGEALSILFNIVGTGTDLLAGKRTGEMLDILGPLGTPYHLDGDYDTAILVAGGLGVAPLPILTAHLEKKGKRIETFVGARTENQIVTDHLDHLHIATDDGSAGYRGTVVDVLRSKLAAEGYPRPRIFACGPTPMLRSLALLAAEVSVPCEVSLESAMACGIGLCQGCPVEYSGGESVYGLICRDGTVFDTRSIKFA